MEIYIARDGNETGPYTQDQIESLHRTGMLQLNDFVWHDGMPDWEPLHRFLGVRPPTPVPPTRVEAPLHTVTEPSREEVSPQVHMSPATGIRQRGFWEVYIPIVLTFGIYCIYLLPRQAWEIERITGRKRLNPWLLGVLVLLTVGIFGAIYQVYLAWKFQGLSEAGRVVGRNVSLGMMAMTFTMGSFAISFSSFDFALLASAVFGVIPFWLIQKEINLCLGNSHAG
jgi:hypothetical protein